MINARPTTTEKTATALCPCCGEPLRLVRTIPKLGGLRALTIFLCERCGHVETIEQDQAA
jgi:hypothetical protein